ncbi:AMP-binding protein [Gimesia aquarii]|uniref:Long-chain-fatty-acid--CoA ligase n=1 Tax=Gimesia aquarii TaxID=2527964 RepID=A0A517WX76_9PLAN|nr:AMP-binding protein [Gimesia aquarii]QDU09877.1 Long-chain-fatty-acid--CoA ligase [Gimesia aquarii]
MNICEHLTVSAQIFPEREALVFNGNRFTYAELERLSSQAACYLQDLAVQPGDRVAIALPNTPAFVVWYYAVLRVGAIAVSVSTRLTSQEIRFIVEDCTAVALVVVDSKSVDLQSQMPACMQHLILVSESGDKISDEFLNVSESGPIDIYPTEPNDPAVILYTSGTTGFPKGATLSHQNVRATVHAFNNLCGLNQDDRILCSVPLFHCYGQNALLNSGFHAAATIVLQQRFDLNESKSLIMDEGVNKLFGVPTMFQLLEETCSLEDLKSINYCFSAATTLPQIVAERWQQKFKMPIYEGYGLTETAPFASYNHRLKFVPGSIGSPVDLVEMKVVHTETGETCAPGELGEIVVRGPNVMLGYWNRPDDTAIAIRDGWFHSGDIGRIDEQGYFYIVDRVKDMISIAGLKVFPAEVERTLHEHAAISDVAVVGLADAILGEKVVAFIVLAKDLQTGSEVTYTEVLEQLREFCQQNLASYKMPKHLLLIDELPRNPSGKILKRVLREQAESMISETQQEIQAKTDIDVSVSTGEAEREGAKQKIHSAWVTEMLKSHPANRLREITSMLQLDVQKMLQLDELPNADERFIEAGLDSLLIVDLQERLKQRLGHAVDLPATLVFDYPSIAELAVFLSSILEEIHSNNDSDRETPGSSVSRKQTVKIPQKEGGGDILFTGNPSETSDLEAEIEGLSEQEALEQLIRELKN